MVRNGDDLLRITVTPSGTDDVGVVTLTGEFDMLTRPLVDSAVVSMPPCLVLDARGLTFVDSAGVHALLELRSDRLRRGGWLHLVYEPGQQLARVLGILQLDRLLPSYGDVKTAAQG